MRCPKPVGLMLALTLSASARAYADPPPTEVDPPPTAAAPETLPPAVLETPPPAVPTSADHNTSLRTIGWVVTGVGGAALVGSGAMFALRAHESSELDHEASKAPPDLTMLHEHLDRADGYHTAGLALLVTGAVGVGAGVTLLLFAPKDHAANTANVAVGPGNVALTGSF
jgi:hypothetical protein